MYVEIKLRNNNIVGRMSVYNSPALLSLGPTIFRLTNQRSEIFSASDPAKISCK
ncbi:hypothetical protein M501DRAFT_1021075 [Patellaria atrata CBS 101060]|uniref:Uncharacterized protein n=1 Tax=Patellaria atrata CBS 101060 TaxID=1346257 RepID=A0A9P4VLY6_9PEZI|nr:hypothetical protein M501DRAFT_1021075 [Patellaria atrata CBS 101060]